MSHTVHIDPILLGKVSKPARYIGGEWNSVVKDHHGWDVSNITKASSLYSKLIKLRKKYGG